MGLPAIIAERKGKYSSGKMRSLVALTLVLAVAAGDMMMKKKIYRDMMTMNSQAMCWGQGNMMYYKMAMMQATEECMGGHTTNTKPTSPFAQLNRPQNPFQTLPSAIQAKNPFSGDSFNKKPTVNPDSLKSILFSNFDSRKKRQADGLIEVTEEDFAEFLGDFADFKDDVASKMSNLTCVLSKLDMLDADYQVNLKAYGGRWLQRLLRHRQVLPPVRPEQEPHHEGVRTSHGLLQVHQEGGGSLLRHGLRRSHAGDPLRRHQQLRLDPVRSAQEQVREGRHDHEGHVQHRLARGGLRAQLLLHGLHELRNSIKLHRYLPNDFSFVIFHF